TLAGLVIDTFNALLSFSPMASFSAAWQPVAGYFTQLWSGITGTVATAIDWIAGKIGWVMSAGKQVGDWFGSLFGEDKTSVPTPAAPGNTPPPTLGAGTVAVPTWGAPLAPGPATAASASAP